MMIAETDSRCPLKEWTTFKQLSTNTTVSIKKVSDYMSQLRRIGQGHGVCHFDQMLLNGGDVVVMIRKHMI